MSSSLKKLVLKNTVSNYVVLITGILVSIVITRMLYLKLGEISYGFWILLWTMFGYSLLLDFGFGSSAQKYTAEVTVSQDFKRYNKIISTIFTSYLMMSLVVFIAASIFQSYLNILIKASDADLILYYRKAFMLFALGAVLTFPTGVFSEILRGLKQIYVMNLIKIVTLIIQFIGIYVIVNYYYGLITLIIFSVFMNFLKNILMAIMSFVFLKKMVIRFKFDIECFKSIIGFSVCAYFLMVAHIIIYNTDRVVVSAILGVSSVAVYQISSRLSFVMLKMCTQFQENLSPIAASLYKSGEHNKLKYILLESNRLIAFMTIIFFVLITVLAKPVLFVWLNVTSVTAIRIAYIMNISILLLIMFRSASTKVLFMSGFHKMLATIGMIEAVLNIILSIIFIKIFGVIGVAIGTLVPNIFFSVFIIFPTASKFSKVSIKDYLTKVYVPIILAAVPSVAILLIHIKLIPLLSWNLLYLIQASVLAGLIYVVLCYIFVANAQEKMYIRNLLNIYN